MIITGCLAACGSIMTALQQVLIEYSKPAQQSAENLPMKPLVFYFGALFLCVSLLPGPVALSAPDPDGPGSDSHTSEEKRTRLQQGFATVQAAGESAKAAASARDVVWETLGLSRDIVDVGTTADVKLVSEIVLPLCRRSGDQTFQRDLTSYLKDVTEAIELRDRVQAGKATPTELALHDLLLREDPAATAALRGLDISHFVALADAEDAVLRQPGAEMWLHTAKTDMDVANKLQGLLKDLCERRALRHWAKAVSANPKNADLTFRKRIDVACTRELPVHKLSLHLTMDRISKGAVASQTGGYLAQSVSNPSFVPGILSRAVALNGRDQYLRVPKFDSGSEFSMGVWLRCSLVPGKPQHCIVSNDSSGLHNGFGILVLEDGRLSFRQGRNGERQGLNSATACIVSDQWHHVSFTFNGPSQRFTMYVDGEPQETVGGVVWDFPSDGEWRVGGHVYQRLDFPLMGMIDDFRVYSRELHRHEIRHLSGKW